MWFPTKNGEIVKEADEASSQAYRIAFRADPVAHYRKMAAALSKRLGKKVSRLGKMAVMIQEPGTENMAPGIDFVAVEYFLEDGTRDYAVLSHAASSDTYAVDLPAFDALNPKCRQTLRGYGCVNMFDLMKGSSLPEKIG